MLRAQDHQPPGWLRLSFPAIAWVGVDATVAPGQEALGTDGLGSCGLNSQGPDQVPLGKWGRKIRLQRGILAIAKLYELETKNLSARQIHKPEQPPELLPASPSGPIGDLDPEWGIRGLAATEEHEPWDSHCMSGP